MPNNRGKIHELESIRGLAALLIVFVHIPKWNPVLDLNIIYNGSLMVELFFVISGFVIFAAYSEKIHSVTDLLKFQFLRMGRLYPIHLVFLLLFVLIETGKLAANNMSGVPDIKVSAFSTNSIAALLEQLFLLQAVLPNGNAMTFNSPAWSISVEFYTYIIFGLTVFFFKQHRHYVIGIFTIIFVTALSLDITFGLGYLFLCLTGFFIGCLTSYASKQLKYRFPGYVPSVILLLFILLLQKRGVTGFDALITFGLTAALILTLLASSSFLNSLFNQKVLLWLGEISYSVYMSHAFVIWVVSQIFVRVFRLPEVNGAGGVALSISGTVLAVIFTVGLVLLVSQITYSFIEKPLREHTRKLIAFVSPKTAKTNADA